MSDPDTCRATFRRFAADMDDKLDFPARRVLLAQDTSITALEGIAAHISPIPAHERGKRGRRKLSAHRCGAQTWA